MKHSAVAEFAGLESRIVVVLLEFAEAYSESDSYHIESQPFALEEATSDLMVLLAAVVYQMFGMHLENAALD